MMVRTAGLGLGSAVTGPLTIIMRLAVTATPRTVVRRVSLTGGTRNRMCYLLGVGGSAWNTYSTTRYMVSTSNKVLSKLFDLDASLTCSGGGVGVPRGSSPPQEVTHAIPRTTRQADTPDHSPRCRGDGQPHDDRQRSVTADPKPSPAVRTIIAGQYVVVGPRTLADRNAIARTGASIDYSEDGKLYVSANLDEVKTINALASGWRPCR